ncbi:peptidoglycan DD-metalloendopeptidase family protein [Evansella sp. AB-rgal1]|uniref:peptidoglycan DD-metalloendopeptidase family protein n=1 Tax=Evansella sp. AB-rgal1 TaxID=3242696 RepID=UPI00359D0750
MSMLLHPQKEKKEKSIPSKLAERKAKQARNKVFKKLAKKAMVATQKAAVKAIGMLIKFLITKLIAIGGILGAKVLLIFVCVVLVGVAITTVFSLGKGLEEPDDIEFYNHVVAEADKTVNMSLAEEVPYRVPEILLTSVSLVKLLQSEKDYDYTIISETASALAPHFERETFNAYTEKQVIVEDEELGIDEGEIIRTDNYVDMLTFVDAWNEWMDITYEEKLTQWNYQVEHTTRTMVQEVAYSWYEEEVISYSSEPVNYLLPNPIDSNGVPVYDRVLKHGTKEIEVEYKVKITTKTREKRIIETNRNHEEDYSRLDNILNSFGYGSEDKMFIDGQYQFANEESGNKYPVMNYLHWMEMRGIGDWRPGNGFIGTIIPGEGVPIEYMPYYQEAGETYGVNWYTLAAIHYHETSFSTHPTMISNVGAVGHYQFMPRTWLGWSFSGDPYNTVTRLGNIIGPIDITNVSLISQYRGYGRDGNGNGKADPWDLEDAVHTAAHYLASNGYSRDRYNAIRAYNHSDVYVRNILDTAEKYKLNATYIPDNPHAPYVTLGQVMYPTTGRITSGFGERWGRMHRGVDIGLGGRSGDIPIVAFAEGKVIESKYMNDFGNMVVIEHTLDGELYHSLYAHLQNRAVKIGDYVTMGSFLGYMGNTGSVQPTPSPSNPRAGTHLHFEIHRGGCWDLRTNVVDPLLFLPPLYRKDGDVFW